MLPLGKLPPNLLAQILQSAPVDDPSLIVGPGVGLDCAVVALDETCLVFKTDPITFATGEIGWYAVQVNANDIATTGAVPLWFLATILLPEARTSTETVKSISEQIFQACRSLGITVIGGHTEITYGIERPIVAGTMIGKVTRKQLITPKGACPGDRILLTKGVPIEGTAILAREFPEKLKDIFSPEEIEKAGNYLYNPGISVVRDAKLAVQAGGVTAMHDPTEGGLAGALWELAEACDHTLVIDPQTVPIPTIAKKICEYFAINPLETIASGGLLLSALPQYAKLICEVLQNEGINCSEIGTVLEGPSQVLQFSGENTIPLNRPDRDEIARLFERTD